ncbi:NAD-dependent epimerase/dehydratase family protein [Sporosarcina limicola]|uniref:UDP-glucose 4-epimerase n=1 Tax=Sporosarcina limicola TaxID=34101 RepID=A0A927MMJ6_9BACL|nr:NAD-dependent epimerase/dehydratase family protein [Sporosarcina limicola]MBE1557080.1 UDP-glucose 4-epimerase [Sporosarcina limicola]
MKVLLTGGAGFIGSHVTEELLKHKFQVVTIDNFVTGFQGNIPGKVKFYQMDLGDKRVELVFKQEKPDYVIHLAAQASVMASMTNPYLDFFTNTVGTVKLLDLSKKYNVKKFLFASTAAVYGEPLYLPVDEDHLIHTQSFYALSKYSAENYIKQYSTLNGLDSCILRFSNVYGPRQNENGEAGVISIFINRLLANETVDIYDGSQTRDFIYVKDVAVACRLSLEKEVKGVLNISSCIETEISELYDQIAGIMEINAQPSYEPKRVGEIEKSILDNQKARRELSWDLHHSLLKGLEDTVQYYTEKYLTSTI